MFEQVWQEASGARQRPDPVTAGTGGPAGNARLVAGTGVLLLALFLAELVTLLDVAGLAGWHVAIGVLLVPPALVKTAATGWRVLRYYTGAAPYRVAGPPPGPLRLLGPLVVLLTLALLGTGLALSALGPTAGRTPLAAPLGYPVTPLTLHQAVFIGWAAVTGLHLLARAVPATRILLSTRLPGRGSRTALLAIATATAAVAAVLLLPTATPWHTEPHHHSQHMHP